MEGEMGLGPDELPACPMAVGEVAELPFWRSAPDKAIDELYRSERLALKQYIGRMVRNRGDGEDIVQEAFVRTWRALSAGNVRYPRAVLYRTARNLALNHIRDARVRNSDAARTTLNDIHDCASANAEDAHIAGEDTVICRRVFERLPPRCREALALRVIDELSYAEMSSRMGLSISTIEKHIARGKQIFRTYLSSDQPDGKQVEMTTCTNA
jgi:RNA polymerase sigma factor (sigma-70 family)